MTKYLNRILLAGLIIAASGVPLQAKDRKGDKEPPQAQETAPAVPAPEAPPEEDEAAGRPGKLLKALNRLDLSKEQRLKIHQYVDEADDERIRLGRKAKAAGEEIRQLTRTKLAALFKDDRKTKISGIVEEEFANADKARQEKRDEPPAGHQGPPPPESRREDRPKLRERAEERFGKRANDVAVAIETYERLKDRLFDEIKMNDTEAEKALAVFAEIRTAAREKAEQFREEFKKLKDSTKAKVMTSLSEEQRKKFEEELERIKSRRRNRD